MKHYFFIDQNEQQQGPFPGEELIQFGITPETYVWCEGMPDWQRAKYVPELNQLFHAAPPVPPQPPVITPEPVSPESSEAVYEPEPQVLVENDSYKEIPPLPNNFLTWAILCTIFCCVPFGIVGIVYASKVNGLYALGKYDEANYSARKAKFWTSLGFWIGLGLILLYIIWVIVVWSIGYNSYVHHNYYNF